MAFAAGGGIGSMVRQRSPMDDVADLFGFSLDAPQQQGSPYEALLMQLALAPDRGQTSVQQAIQQSYAPVIQALRQDIGQIGAQGQQNVADIRSWFGQLGRQARRTTRSNTKAGRKAARDQARFDRTILSGIADPNVARNLGRESMNEQRFIGRTNRGQRRADVAAQRDVGRQGTYQAMVQQRLAQQAQVDMFQELAKARGQRSAAMAQATAGAEDQRFQRLLALAQFSSQNQPEDPMNRAAQMMQLMGGAQNLGLIESPVDPTEQAALLINQLAGPVSAWAGEDKDEQERRLAILLQAMGLQGQVSGPLKDVLMGYPEPEKESWLSGFSFPNPRDLLKDTAKRQIPGSKEIERLIDIFR